MDWANQYKVPVMVMSPILGYEIDLTDALKKAMERDTFSL